MSGPLRVGAALATLIISAACATRLASRSPRAVSGAPAGPLASLNRDLDAYFADPRLAHATWGVHVRSLRTGETLYAHDPARLIVPASNQKVLTTAVAAHRLGWEYRFTTRLLATGPVGPDGTLEGHLVVTSDGDPTINPRHQNRWRVFDEWARTLRQSGLRAVTGDLVGDDNLVEEPGWGDGWAWNDLQFGYGAPVGALQYHENQVEVMVGPGLTPHSPAIVGISPLGSGLLLDASVSTGVPAAETRVQASRLPGTLFLKVEGQIAQGAKPIILMTAAENPTRLYVSALQEALARYGIVVGGRAVDIDELRATLDMTHASELLVDRSPPLAEIIDVTLKWSRNGYAETLLLALSEAPPATAAKGLSTLGATLRGWGASQEHYVARDGSGLSRNDNLSAALLTWVLARVWADPRHREAFRASLPSAGESGTLADRTKGSRAVGRVWAKTGSMSNVRTLAGYALTEDNEPLAFAILANNFLLPTSEIEAVIDRAVELLVAFQRQHPR